MGIRDTPATESHAHLARHVPDAGRGGDGVRRGGFGSEGARYGVKLPGPDSLVPDTAFDVAR